MAHDYYVKTIVLYMNGQIYHLMSSLYNGITLLLF